MYESAASVLCGATSPLARDQLDQRVIALDRGAETAARLDELRQRLGSVVGV
jgi:hypothetical protein